MEYLNKQFEKASKLSKKITNEAKNIWGITSLLAESTAAISLVYLALGFQNELPKYATAIAGGILIANILAKLYTLNRK